MFYEESATVDVDECVEGTSGCEQTCSNTPGSFLCGCQLGYTLVQDGNGIYCNGTLIFNNFRFMR